jgi:RHH-type proline utilization regulon transcriptional repressor/proline dehydrogenase/delta 1-pyrroline-5-carboxylate dehydrogenase
MPLVHRRLRSEAGGVILPADDPGLGSHLAARSAEGVRCNVNVLGEAIVGECEAERRLEMVIERLRRPDVDYVSVKISAICPAIDPLAFDDTVQRVIERLRPLYRVAASYHPAKFVNLDMEEYQDLALTVAAFRELLDEDEFGHLDAGIVLQAYLPDARSAAVEVATWAVDRHRRAGGRIKIRIVKGANLAMEHAAAELAGWEPAPFGTKPEVDANYKAVLDLLCAQRFDDAVRIGVASHNLFDVAWAIGIARDHVAAGRPARIEFEMLEGMAPSQADAVRSATGDLLLYSPVVARDDFAAAIAYLVRRLDENTQSDNFLAHVFELAGDPSVFAAEAERFAAAVRDRHSVVGRPRRDQRRGVAVEPVPVDGAFRNAPDTDWTRASNRAWIADAMAVGFAPGPTEQILVDVVDHAVAAANAARHRWEAIDPVERAAVINRVGDEFEAARGRILATMATEAGKTVAQGDPEVSEAVDFARYYAREGMRLAGVDGATGSALGTVVVTPPWNFPVAIPAGGVLASLAAGNAVILKPAPQTRQTARLVAECCWAAGVPDDALQFVPADDDDAGRLLITHPDVAAVILTGAHETARMFLSWRPDLRLHAETSGKNALVISASADIDDAVADLVASAFGHAGQKCSAASLAIVEAALYDDPRFLERVRDAAATLRVGPASDLSSDVGPLIEPPGPRLERALTTLEPGERWLLEPTCRSDDRRLWSPGIRVDVRPGSWFARTECFGPVLGVVRADDLDHALEIQNDTDFGLTAGLHSLDPAEIERWLDRVEAGNLYVNRGTTGAIVQRQPFGGWKRSSVGPTAKAGGPNYVATLQHWTDDEQVGIDLVESRFESWWATVGSVEHDPTGLAVERNVFRSRPLPGGVAVRFGERATDRQRHLIRAAARVTGARLVVSESAGETAAAFADRLDGLGVDRYRAVGDVLDCEVIERCHELGISVDAADPVGAPQIELPRWRREQAVSVTMHRHGRVDRERSNRSR